jgi:multidrug resistance protein, MATE family
LTHSTNPFADFPSFSALRKEWRALITLGLPLAIAELSGIMLNIIDTAMIGNLGAESVAAVSIATSVFLQITLLGIGAMIMSSPLSATALEQEDFFTLKKLLVGGAYTAVGLAAVLMAIMCLANLNFELLGQTATITASAKNYLWAIMPNVFFLLLYIHLVHFADGLSLTRVGMILSFSTLIVHVFLNWLLINGHCGFPALGILGAGISTSIAQGITTTLMLIYVNKAKAFAQINAVKISFSETIDYCVTYLKISLPAGIQIEVEYLAWAVGATWMGWLGTNDLAAHQIAVVLATSTFMIMLSIGTAGGIRIGQANNNPDKMRLTGIAAMLLAFMVIALPALSYLFIPGFWASYFIEDAAVVAIAVPLIIIAGFFQFCDAVQAISLALLRGRGDTQLPSLFSLISYWGFGMPIGYYLAFHCGWRAQGIWIGFLLSLLVQTMFFSVRFFGGLKKDIKHQAGI